MLQIILFFFQLKDLEMHFSTQFFTFQYWKNDKSRERVAIYLKIFFLNIKKILLKKWDSKGHFFIFWSTWMHFFFFMKRFLKREVKSFSSLFIPPSIMQSFTYTKQGENQRHEPLSLAETLERNGWTAQIKGCEH